MSSLRVANRTRIAPGKNVRQVEDRLVRWIPKPFLKDAHYWLILRGRYVCTARKPRCTVEKTFSPTVAARENSPSAQRHQT